MVEETEGKAKNLPDVFDGKMNPEIVEMLRSKIASLGLPKSYIAKVLGISVQTIRKWLNSETARCSSVARLKLMRFLNGEYDRYLNGQRKAEEKIYSIGELPDNMLLCMERISRIYDYCSKSEEMREAFVERMDKAAFNALMALIPDGEEKTDL
ncbi:MAG: hypothetical protein IJS15_13610 [Victivallales bacterium]|nr:hypothetical protein [Victivallales bacterium]